MLRDVSNSSQMTELVDTMSSAPKKVRRSSGIPETSEAIVPNRDPINDK